MILAQKAIEKPHQYYSDLVNLLAKLTFKMEDWLAP